jgi:hypothetical protein
MESPKPETLSRQTHDKQLQGVALETVLEKRRLDQALNAKEFAVSVGVSYSTARSWFHLPGFPVFHGVVFWSDFVQWRAEHYGLEHPPIPQPSNDNVIANPGLPPRAAKILLDS